jgi:iron complex transport system substrate-binding protein
LLPLATLLACGSQPEARQPQRVVALAPNIVESLFALGVGDRLVGVGDYCRWPPEVAALPKIGGLFDASLEQITALQPDLAILLPSEESLRSQLERLGVEVMTVRNESLEDVDQAVIALAERFGVPVQGSRLVAEWRRALAPRREGPPLRVLLSVSRLPGKLSDILVAGPGTFLDELLGRLGSTNVFADASLLYPQVGLDEIVRRWPDAIIELQPSPANFGALVEDWRRALPDLPAVQADCVHVIAGDHVLIPGPRLPRLYRELRETLASCAPAP